MFTFTQTINLYDADKGFNVLYRPDDLRLSAISQWIKLPPLSDKDEIMRRLINAAPQGEWQRQIDILTEDSEMYRSLIGTQLEVKDIAPTEINTFDSSTIEQIRSKIV